MRTWIAMLAGLALISAGPAPSWKPIPTEDLLVIETSKGRIVVVMAPEIAPKAVERIRLLARERVYDGLLFHRVIEGFVDQTGNPNNKDGGASSHPDLAPEFQFKAPPSDVAIAVRRSDSQEGFVGATPVALASPGEFARATDGKLRGWGAYCPGVAGMGRQAAPGSANSEIFFMRAPSRRLDHEYTVWGRVVVGLEVVRAIAVGEPPAAPDRMLKVRVASDLPAGERPRLEILDGRSPAYAAWIAAARRKVGPAFTVCDLEVPIRGR